MKIVFVINNKNNRLGKILPALCRFFEKEYAGRVEFLYTLRKRHAVELARKATAAGCDYLIAAGGDGTLNEVTNGIMKSGVTPGEYPVLGLLPLGSANDFARTAGINASWEELDQWIRQGSIRQIDVGRISLHHPREERFFLNIAGIGLGPEVVLKMDRTRSILGPSFHYFKSILSGFLSYRKKRVLCQCSSWKWEGELLQMAVANGRFFGNAICIAPDASLSDGQFQVVIFGDLSMWDYLKNLRNLKRGKKIDHPEVRYHIAKELRLESTDACGIEADGEYVGSLPVSVKILPGALRLLSAK